MIMSHLWCCVILLLGGVETRVLACGATIRKATALGLLCYSHLLSCGFERGYSWWILSNFTRERIWCWFGGDVSYRTYGYWFTAHFIKVNDEETCVSFSYRWCDNVFPYPSLKHILPLRRPQFLFGVRSTLVQLSRDVAGTNKSCWNMWTGSRQLVAMETPEVFIGGPICQGVPRTGRLSWLHKRT